jgi:hypothetical protein
MFFASDGVRAGLEVPGVLKAVAVGVVLAAPAGALLFCLTVVGWRLLS